jgi:hypothetical protein
MFATSATNIGSTPSRARTSSTRALCMGFLDPPTAVFTRIDNQFVMFGHGQLPC